MNRNSGRFGKYGDLKRKEKIRQVRLFRLDHVRDALSREPSGGMAPGRKSRRRSK